MHEPSSDGTAPAQRFVKNQDAFGGPELEKLYGSVHPSDRATYLMQALRMNEDDTYLEEYIPFTHPELTALRQINIHSYELTSQAWRHNALTLASQLSSGRRRDLVRMIVRLLNTGMERNEEEAEIGINTAITTAAAVRDVELIRSVARYMPLALQRWFCTQSQYVYFRELAEWIIFVVHSLPGDFAGFSATVPCSPIREVTLLAVSSREDAAIDSMCHSVLTSKMPRSQIRKAFGTVVQADNQRKTKRIASIMGKRRIRWDTWRTTSEEHLEFYQAGLRREVRTLKKLEDTGLIVVTPQ